MERGGLALGEGRLRGRGWDFLLSLVSVPATPQLPSVLTSPCPPVEPIAARLKEARLQRDDFEILKVIGRGAFSEVSLERRLQLARTGDATFRAVGGTQGFGAGP